MSTMIQIRNVPDEVRRTLQVAGGARRSVAIGLSPAPGAFRRLSSAGEIDPARGSLMLDVLRDMPIERHAHAQFLSRIWQLCTNVTACDAIYVVLAEVLGAPLLTRHARLVRAVGHLIAVELI